MYGHNLDKFLKDDTEDYNNAEYYFELAKPPYLRFDPNIKSDLKQFNPNMMFNFNSIPKSREKKDEEKFNLVLNNELGLKIAKNYKTE